MKTWADCGIVPPDMSELVPADWCQPPAERAKKLAGPFSHNAEANWSPTILDDENGGDE